MYTIGLETDTRAYFTGIIHISKQLLLEFYYLLFQHHFLSRP